MATRVPDDLHDRYAAWRWEKVYEWIPGRPTFRLTPPDPSSADGHRSGRLSGGQLSGSQLSGSQQAGSQLSGGQQAGGRLGGSQLADGDLGVRYLKVQPVGTGLPDEATRLRWAADRVRAPRLIEYGSDGFQDWLMTAELSGAGAAEHPLRTSDPVRLATVFAQGLRAFHDAFDVDDCPFDFRLPTALRAAGDRVAAAERLSAARAAAADRAAADRVAADRVAADRLVANANTTDAVAEREATEREAAEREAAETEAAAKAGADEPRALLERARVLAEEITGLSADAWDTGEDLVVCHGDYCLPNAFLEDGSPDGTAVTGYIDLGGLAVADRWYDLAVALRSLEQPYNLGPGYGAVFLDAYGAKMDERKNELYLILYDLTF